MTITWTVLLLASLLGCSAAPQDMSEVSKDASGTASEDDKNTGPAQSTKDGISFLQNQAMSKICSPLVFTSVCIENTVDAESKSLMAELTVNGVQLFKKEILGTEICYGLPGAQYSDKIKVCLQRYHTEGTWSPPNLNNCFKVTLGLVLLDMGCYRVTSSGIQLNTEHKVNHGNLVLMASSGDNSQTPHIELYGPDSLFDMIPGGAGAIRVLNMFSGGVPGEAMLSSIAGTAVTAVKATASKAGAAATRAGAAASTAATVAGAAATGAASAAATAAVNRASAVASTAYGWVPSVPRWGAPKTTQEPQTS